MAGLHEFSSWWVQMTSLQVLDHLLYECKARIRGIEHASTTNSFANGVQMKNHLQY